MKLNEYISNLLDIVNKNLEYGELEVIYQYEAGGGYNQEKITDPPKLVDVGYLGESISRVNYHPLDNQTNAIIIN